MNKAERYSPVLAVLGHQTGQMEMLPRSEDASAGVFSLDAVHCQGQTRSDNRFSGMPGLFAVEFLRSCLPHRGAEQNADEYREVRRRKGEQVMWRARKLQDPWAVLALVHTKPQVP